MPGKESLRQRQYYAHPGNAFWKIVGEILGFDAGGNYDARASSLSAAGIALWDVLKSCTRESSLDSDIDNDTIVLNDFASFFASHPQIRRICFNGAKAEQLYHRHVLKLMGSRPEMEYVRLPSTSPAHAAITFEDKLRAWRRIAA
jgi:hypoxanthine-DNA glycosylase